MGRLNSRFWVNFGFSAMNLFFFFTSIGSALGMLNLVAGIFCGYWAYEAIKGV